MGFETIRLAHTQQVSSEHFKNNQDLPAGYFTGQIGGYFSKVPCWAWVGGIGGYFLKVFTTYLLGMSQANCFKTHNKLTMYPLGKLPFTPSDTWSVCTWLVYRPH